MYELCAEASLKKRLSTESAFLIKKTEFNGII